MSQSILVTESKNLILSVKKIINTQLRFLPKKKIASSSLSKFGLAILTRNLNFIKHLNLNDFNFSFVVQKDNYKEIVPFFYYIANIFNKQLKRGVVTISFTKIMNWGNLTEEKFTL